MLQCPYEVQSANADDRGDPRVRGVFSVAAIALYPVGNDLVLDERAVHRGLRRGSRSGGGRDCCAGSLHQVREAMRFVSSERCW
jgi:hypothetical protein